MRRTILGLLLLQLSLGAAIRARADADPKLAADSPKAALKAQDAAARSGDIDADIQFYQAEGEQQKKLVQVIAAGDVAVSKLEKAVAERFGKDLATATVRAAGTVDAQAIDAATENVDGDHATVRFADQSTPVPMVRSDGKWKVSISEWTKGASSHDLDVLTSKLDELATQINQVTDLVSHDKFRSGEGVRDRIQELHDRLFGSRVK